MNGSPSYLRMWPWAEKSGLTAEVPRELPGVAVLHYDYLLRGIQDSGDLFTVEGNDPFDRQLVGGDTTLCKLPARLLHRAVGRTPTDQRYLSILRAFQFRRSNQFHCPLHLSAPFLNHQSALVRVGNSSLISVESSSCSSVATT